MVVIGDFPKNINEKLKIEINKTRLIQHTWQKKFFTKNQAAPYLIITFQTKFHGLTGTVLYKKRVIKTHVEAPEDTA